MDIFSALKFKEIFDGEVQLGKNIKINNSTKHKGFIIVDMK